MAQPYVGEIRMFAGNFNPAGWQFCSGQVLAISQYETLFNLIGTTYGGDGQVNFALPDLRGRAPVHFGTSPISGTTYQLAQAAGFETVTLTTQQLPSHSHPVQATTTSQTVSPSNAFPALPASNQAGTAIYDGNTPTVNLNTNTIGLTGGGQPHDNMQPYLAVSYIISMFGIFPSQN